MNACTRYHLIYGFLGQRASLGKIVAKKTALLCQKSTFANPFTSLNSKATRLYSRHLKVHLTATYCASFEKLILHVVVSVVSQPCRIIGFFFRRCERKCCLYLQDELIWCRRMVKWLAGGSLSTKWKRWKNFAVRDDVRREEISRTKSVTLKMEAALSSIMSA